MDPKKSGRRQFLRNGAALAAIAVGAVAAKTVGAQGGQVPQNWNVQPLDTPETREKALNGTPASLPDNSSTPFTACAPVT